MQPAQAQGQLSDTGVLKMCLPGSVGAPVGKFGAVPRKVTTTPPPVVTTPAPTPTATTKAPVKIKPRT